MRQILSLWWLELRYVALMLRYPREARYFWFHLYHEARRADKLVQPSLKYRLPSRDVDAIFPGISDETFSLENFRGGEHGGVSLVEARILAASIRLLQPRTLFEIGTFNGATTVQMALNSPHGAVVHTIDLPENHPLRSDQAQVDVAPTQVGKCYMASPIADKIRQHFGNTAEFDFSPYARTCDWIFIDAAHTYDYVVSDTRNALAMLRPGGVIFWHDVNLAFDGNCRALTQFAREISILRIDGTSLACYRS